MTTSAMGNLRITVTALCQAAIIMGACGSPEAQLARELPPVNASVTNFYYRDLQSAKQWYVDKLGLPIVYDDQWVVIVEIAPGMQVALVDGEEGALKPVEDKGTMLSIETDALEEWYDHVRKIEGVTWYQNNNEDPRNFNRGIREHKDIQEFRILDPEGYLIEFYRWKPGYRPNNR